MLKKLLLFVATIAMLAAPSVAADNPCLDAINTECVEYTHKAAEQGDAEAQNNLGFMYSEGEGVEKNARESARWYRKSAEQGNAEAQYNLGLMYYKEEGVEKDDREAARWIRKSAEQGFAEAQYNLGVMYYKGEGVEKDYREALRWYRKSAEQGVARAQNNLGFMYDEGEGVGEDDREAARWYRKSAEQGNAKAQYSLGAMYRKGEGVGKDEREAARWTRKAAEQGDLSAQNNLGLMYGKGEGVVKDAREAYIWLLIAKSGGDEGAEIIFREAPWQQLLTLEEIKSAEREAARRFEEIENRKNNGEVKNNTQIIEANTSCWDDITSAKFRSAECVGYTRKAAERGLAVAQHLLGFMYDNGEGVEKNDWEAVRWYRKAAEQGFSPAQSNLGLMHYEGEGVEEDEREAYIWLSIAKAGGNETADKALREAPWQEYLTPAQIKSAKREAARRFEEIENRRNNGEINNNAQNPDNETKRNSGEFAIAQPPKQSNIAAEVFENTWRSVVMIEDGENQGGGVIIRPNLVATNCHVVESGGNIAVYKPENRRINTDAPFYAKVIHRNEAVDFCILEVKGLWGIAATIRKYDTLKIGENVYALGAPRGLDLSLSNGLISQLRTGEGARYIQTDAAISPGSSGGGLFDVDGNFIGILTSKYTDEQTEGIGFAIPADLSLEF